MTPIAEFIQNNQVFFEAMWVGLGILSFIFMMIVPIWGYQDEDIRYQSMFVSIWCLGASILVLLASV